MKFTFKYLFAQVPKKHVPLLLVEYVSICTGGSYLPEDGKTELKITPFSIVLKYKDHTAECMNNLAAYFGNSKPMETGYIGKWSKNLEKEVNLYYFVQDNMIHKMFVTIFNGLHLTGVGSMQYIINFKGNMMDCIPEEGDVIYDNIEEAQTAIK